MKKVLFLMFLLFLCLGTVRVSAQVRIGGNAAPNAAAVLDLNVNDDVTPAINKGALALPRVNLTSNTMQLVSGVPNLIGTLVYNTTATSVATGVYVWDGSKWAVSGGAGVGEYGGLDTIRGLKGTYRIWCYPASTGLGCWMVDNSREGTVNATNYANNTSYVSGAYYAQANRVSACPSGWVLPTPTQFQALFAHLTSASATAGELYWWERLPVFAGYWSGPQNANTWSGLGTWGIWWASDGTAYNIKQGISYSLAASSYYYDWLSVRCVK